MNVIVENDMLILKTAPDGREKPTKDKLPTLTLLNIQCWCEIGL